MRQINLLPPEIAERRRVRRITWLIGAAGLGVLALLMVVFLVQAARLASERGRLEDVQGKNAALQRKVDALQGLAQLESTLNTKEQLLSQLTQNEVRWSVLLNDVSLVIPSDVWLTNFSGSIQASLGTALPPGEPVGNISLGGSSFTHLDVAKWLSRLALVREFTFPYLTLSSKTGIAPQQLVSFNSSVQLSSAALRRNQPGGERNP